MQKEFRSKYKIDQKSRLKVNEICLFHCNAQYKLKLTVNRTIIKEKCNMNVGFLQQTAVE